MEIKQGEGGSDNEKILSNLPLNSPTRFFDGDINPDGGIWYVDTSDRGSYRVRRFIGHLDTNFTTYFLVELSEEGSLAMIRESSLVAVRNKKHPSLISGVDNT